MCPGHAPELWSLFSVPVCISAAGLGHFVKQWGDN